MAGEAIEITVTFNETVTVPTVARSDVTGNPKPKIEIDVGGEARTAGFHSTSGSTVLFRYTVDSAGQTHSKLKELIGSGGEARRISSWAGW